MLSILNSDEALPFQTLEAFLDQSEPGSTDEENKQANPGRGRRPTADFVSLFCKLDGNDTRPGESPPKVVVIETPSICFSALKGLQIKRRERSQPTKKRKPTDDKTSLNTTRLRSGRSGNPDNQQTDLSQSDGNQTSDSAEGEESKTPMEALDGLLEAVRSLGEDHGVGITSRIVTAQALGYREYPMNVLQKPEDVRSSSWYFLAGTRLPRSVLLLELRADQRYALLMEIVRNPGEQFSSLFVVKSDYRSFGDIELRSLLTLVEVAQQVPKNIDISSVVGGSRESEVEIRRFRHGSDPKALAERIANRLKLDRVENA